MDETWLDSFLPNTPELLNLMSSRKNIPRLLQQPFVDDIQQFTQFYSALFEKYKFKSSNLYYMAHTSHLETGEITRNGNLEDLNQIPRHCMRFGYWHIYASVLAY